MSLIFLLISTALVLEVWLVSGLALVGVGLLAQRAAGVQRLDTRQVLMAFWMGLALVVLVLQLWHFLLPVDGWITLLVLVCGAAGLAPHGAALSAWLVQRMRQGPWALLLLGLAAAYLAHRAAGPCAAYDSGLYHLSAVRWNHTYALVPGLGNLHERLAFNNSSLLYAALFEWGPLEGRSRHFVNGLLVLVLLAHGVAAGRRLLTAWLAARGRRTPRPDAAPDSPRPGPATCGWALLLIPAAGLAMDPTQYDVASLSTDTATSAVGLAAVGMLLALLTEPQADRPGRVHELLAACALMSLCVCFKASAAAFGLAGWLAATGVWLGRQRAEPRRDRFRPLVLATVLSAALVGPWLARGVVLSGYPLFPLQTAALPVAWKVPRDTADKTRLSIRSWARTPFVRPEKTRGLQWVGGWIGRLPRYPWLVLTPVTLTAAGLATMLALRRRPPSGPPPGTAPGWLALAPVLAGLAAWLWSAPDPRFSPHLFWGLALVTFGLAGHRVLAVTRRPWWPAALLAAVVLLALPVDYSGVLNHLRGGPMMPTPKLVYFHAAGPSPGLVPTAAPKLRRYTTRHGLVIWVPQKGDQVYDAPLPAAPKGLSDLRLRRPGELWSGFVIDRSPAADGSR